MGLGCNYVRATIMLTKKKTSADGRRKGKIKQTKGIPNVKRHKKYT
jgi:hypothetical protein